MTQTTDHPGDRSGNPPGAQDHPNGDTEPAPGPLTPWQITASTLASAFGVQSSRNRERDFSRGKASHFIIAGIVFTVLFVLGMAFVVNLVLSSAAG